MSFLKEILRGIRWAFFLTTRDRRSFHEFLEEAVQGSERVALRAEAVEIALIEISTPVAKGRRSEIV